MYGSCLDMVAQENTDSFSIKCGFFDSGGNQCPINYRLRYDHDLEVFAIYTTRVGLGMHHCHKYSDVAALTGFQLEEYNLEDENLMLNIDESQYISAGNRMRSYDPADDGPPKSLVVVLKYRSDKSMNENPLLFNENNVPTNAAEHSNASSSYLLPENTCQRESSHRSSALEMRSLQEPITPNGIIKSLSDEECQKISKTVHALSVSMGEFKVGDSPEELKAFKEEINELLFFTQMLFDRRPKK
ncbi:unnamed protein product [Ambrosiozyma monospora]|uniref:Unnamed protein product n=1 Tax=Ambrosiozyma monospora TaxID=43982 RepID=A0ACB5T9W0_AMBMO|nr:unnamed protein product [Ambrosiozyma monospora]